MLLQELTQPGYFGSLFEPHAPMASRHMQVCDVDQLEEVVEHRLGCAPNMKYFYQPAKRTYIGNPHQYNCTYFSALHGNPKHYLLARAIQFFTPGLPMVYYVGLLAGRNDHEVQSLPTRLQYLAAMMAAGMSRVGLAGNTV